MFLANSQKQFQLHLESYLVYEKEHKVGHCHQLCSLLFFLLLLLLSVHIKNVKLFISQFLWAYYLLLHSKEGNWTMGRIR